MSPSSLESASADAFIEALLARDRRAAATVVSDAMEQGWSIQRVYLEIFAPSQYEVGARWERNEITVAQEHYCSAATQLIMSGLYERIFATPRIGRGILATCVAGDLHEIGLRMVADFFELAGWDSHFLGANTPTGDVAAAVHTFGVDAVAIGVTMSAHLPEVERLIAAIRSRNGTIPILVGGHPFTRAPDLCDQMGASGTADNAQAAVELAQRLVA